MTRAESIGLAGMIVAGFSLVALFFICLGRAAAFGDDIGARALDDVPNVVEDDEILELDDADRAALIMRFQERELEEQVAQLAAVSELDVEWMAVHSMRWS